jgi:hypothetical protein
LVYLTPSLVEVRSDVVTVDQKCWLKDYQGNVYIADRSEKDDVEIQCSFGDHWYVDIVQFSKEVFDVHQNWYPKKFQLILEAYYAADILI